MMRPFVLLACCLKNFAEHDYYLEVVYAVLTDTIPDDHE